MEKVVETSEGDYGVTKTNKEISSHSKRDMVFPPLPPPPPPPPPPPLASLQLIFMNQTM